MLLDEEEGYEKEKEIDIETQTESQEGRKK